MNEADQLFLEDFSVGDRFVGPRHVVTRQHFESFADMTGDAHPIHYDPDYAGRTRFGRPIAHGLLMMAYSALGATDLSPRLESAMGAMLEQGCRFTAPVFAGDGITPEFTVETVEARAGSSSGRLRFSVQMKKDDGAICFSGFHLYQLRRKTSGGAIPA